MSDSPELLKPNEVTDSELQIKLGNLQAENERLQADYTKLLESSTRITNKLRQELAQVRSQLATECADREEVEAQLSDREGKLAAALEQNKKSATATKDLPEAADLLNQLKGLRKKSRADLADIDAILGLLADDNG